MRDCLYYKLAVHYSLKTKLSYTEDVNPANDFLFIFSYISDSLSLLFVVFYRFHFPVFAFVVVN